MFPTAILAFFVYSICEIEIQCSVIRDSPVPEARDSTNLKNFTLLKRIENVAIPNKPVPPSRMEMKQINFPSGRNKPQNDLDREDIPTISLLEKENQVLISNGENPQPKNGPGRRKPKFFAPLAFLSGLGAGSLATAASINANALAVKILSSAVPVPIAAPGYLGGFYGPQQYLPYSYPVFYPVPRLADNYANFPNGMPVIPSPISPQVKNATNGRSSPKNDTNLSPNDEVEDRLANEKAEESTEAVTTEADVKRTIASDADNDSIESPAMNEKAELRQADNRPQRTTTAEPVMISTSPVSNLTAVPSWMNGTESWPFYGYYGGSPQDVGHVILTTEDPLQRYLPDYHGDGFALPFERPTIFNPYQNAESYPNSFANSFSHGEPYSEFLNTIESDRYPYDPGNHRNFNGFRPILK